MKKVLLAVAIIFGAFFSSQAQEIGVRWGDLGTGGIDAVFGNRVHASLGVHNGGFSADVLYDFKHEAFDGDFWWYAGVGGHLSTWDGGSSNNDDFRLGAAGEIGIEYRFGGAPLVLGIDYRPTFVLINEANMHFDRFGLNFRYVIGE